MPVLNEIKKIKNGVVGVINWNSSPEEFIKELKNVESSVVTKLSENKLLFSIDEIDEEVAEKYTYISYRPSKEELSSTSIFIKEKITKEEEENILHIIKILIDNGSIRETGINIRLHSNEKTFINFSHKREYDRALTKAFIRHLC